MIRVGIGFDAHQFAKGRNLMLGGVMVPHEFGLAGHSDADVLLHALADALLGAAGLGDIGSYFPDSDSRWKDAASSIFIRTILEELKSRGWRVSNADLTLIAQAPRLTPYREQIRASISTLLEISPDGVNVKATTTDHLGFTGRREGIAAQAVVLLQKDGS